MTDIKRTYELPDEVFDIIKSFLLPKYRRTQQGKIMKEFIKQVQYDYTRSCDRYFYNNTILSFTHEQVEQELKKRFERLGWFYIEVKSRRIDKRNEILIKELEKTKKYSIERSRKADEKPKRFLRK